MPGKGAVLLVVASAPGTSSGSTVPLPSTRLTLGDSGPHQRCVPAVQHGMCQARGAHRPTSPHCVTPNQLPTSLSALCLSLGYC